MADRPSHLLLPFDDKVREPLKEGLPEQSHILPVAWVLLALGTGAAPWVVLAVMLLWPALFP
jgi:hypothetical protein